ncbi:MAG: hypothetical protein EOM73_17405, partial [Bacteroidia bacterium]|nr:hypothetical protein [Bacteroidia bacterium]
MNISGNIKSGFRHLRADKTNTLINLTGLALGLGIVAIVLVFVLNELGYNSSFANRDRIYRVLNFNESDNNIWANTPFIVGETAKEQFAEVEAVVHQYNVSEIEVKKGEEYISDQDVLCTEGAFLEVFGIKLLQGSVAGFDQSKGKIMLSKTSAEKYFGNENPVGKILEIRKDGHVSRMEVVAVYNDLPKNSTIKALFIASTEFGLEKLTENMISIGESPTVQSLKESWYWGEGLFFTNYILIREGTPVAQLETKFRQLGLQHAENEEKL